MRDVGPFDAEFTAHGVGASVLAAAASALETAVRDRGLKQADRTAARTRIQDLLAAAMLHCRRLDLIVDKELAGNNNPLREVWKLARRIHRARATRASGTSDAAASSPPTPTTPAGVAPAATEPAAVDAAATAA